LKYGTPLSSATPGVPLQSGHIRAPSAASADQPTVADYTPCHSVANAAPVRASGMDDLHGQGASSGTRKAADRQSTANPDPDHAAERIGHAIHGVIQAAQRLGKLGLSSGNRLVSTDRYTGHSQARSGWPASRPSWLLPTRPRAIVPEPATTHEPPQRPEAPLRPTAHGHHWPRCRR